METTLKKIYDKYVYSLDKEKTWTEIHEGKRKYSSTGWLCGIEISTMDEPVRKMDEYLSRIFPITILVPPDLALNLYNKAGDLEEFEGQTHVRSLQSGMGSAGTQKEYKFEDGWHQIKTGLHEQKWCRCEPDFFTYYFCTEQQFKMVNHVYGRVPGVLYL